MCIHALLSTPIVRGYRHAPSFVSFLIGLLGVFPAAAYAQQPSGGGRGVPHYHLEGKWKAGGEGSWDYLTLDSPSHRLYVARTDRVQILDTETGAQIREIPGLEGGHGVALAPELNRGFATSGGSDSVLVFNLTSLRPDGAPVAVGKKPDAVVYEPATRHVFVFNGESGDASVLDGATLALVGTISLGGKPEFAVADGSGTVFVNLEDKNEVLAIDAPKNTVTHRWPLAPGSEPTGLALDPIRHRLFAGCRSGQMIVLDAGSGRHLAELPIGKGVDACAVDPGNGTAFASCGDGTLTVVEADPAKPDGLRVAETVQTQRGARTMAFDPRTQVIYLATASFEDAPAAVTGDKPPRPQVVPGSFVLLRFAR